MLSLTPAMLVNECIISCHLPTIKPIHMLQFSVTYTYIVFGTFLQSTYDNKS